MKILSNFFQSIGQWFVDFFTNLWNWFTSTGEDGTKVSYLTRTIICIFIIVVAWIVISLIVKGAKRALRFKKAKSIDVSASSFAIEVIKVVLWLLVAFLVIWILGIDVSSLAGIVSAVTVALGLALQDLIGMFAAGVDRKSVV